MADTIQQILERADLMTRKHVEGIIKESAVELFRRIVLATPVGKPSLWKSGYAPKGYRPGRLRGNWQLSINTPKSDQLEQEDDTGTSTISSQKSEVNPYKITDTIYICNNMPYAEAIEMGHSTQVSANAMVRNNLIKFNEVVEKNIKKL